MKLTVLGKYGPYGKAKTGATSGYLVESNGDYLVMDMGSGTLSRLMGVVDIRKIKDIFISHLHYDHTSDLLPFRYLLEELEHTVNIYTHFDCSDWYKILFEHKNFNIINIDKNSDVTVGNMRLSFNEMKHTATDFAIKIKSDKTLTYTGDTMYCENIDWCFENADAVLMDCSKKAGIECPHMNTEDAIRLSKKYDSLIIATHLSAEYDPTEDLSAVENIVVANEMQEYEI